MQKATSYKSKQFFALVVKLFVVIGCGYFIYDKIFTNQQQSFLDFTSILMENDVFSLKNILLLFVFTFLNWILEITKWKLLVLQVQNISFFEAAKQSLASLTASLITPNRIGEYGAKAMFFKKSFSKKILALNLIGNFSQLVITFIFGILGCVFLLFKFKIEFDYTNILFVLLFFLLLFLVIRFIDKKEISFKGYSIKSFKKFMNDFPKNSIQKIIILSISRFVIFSHQFYFLLLIFNIEILYLDAIMCIFSMYLIASIIPMLSLFDVVLKGSVAILVFSFYQVDKSNILAITLIMWIFNFVIPSIVGSYFVLTFSTNKLIRSKE